MHNIDQFVIVIVMFVEEFVLFKERIRIRQISTQIGYSRQQNQTETIGKWRIY